MTITRRDFLNGVLWTGFGSLGWPLAQLEVWAADAPPAYPPGLTGLRGSHPGAFEAAHTMAWSGQLPAGALAGPVEDYDLIVVGAGISGLSAAYFYRQEVKEDARILILDNHDDFGGHAKRNEFTVDGQLLLSYGGTQSFDTPSAYSAVAKGLLGDLGIELVALDQAYDKEFFREHGLSLGIFCDKASFGQARLLPGSLPTRHAPDYYTRYYVPGLKRPPAFAQALEQLPLPEAQKAKLRQVLTVPETAFAYFKGEKGRLRYREAGYVSFLKDVYAITEPALIALLSMPLAEDSALGGAGVSLANAAHGGLLGLPPLSELAELLDDEDLAEAADEESGEGDEEDGDAETYSYHFPDGNASLARLLAAELVPGLADFDTPAEALTARFDYSRLDRDEEAVRIRLNSLAVEARNTDQGTSVRYLRGGKLHEAHARHTVMAGWHMMTAHVVADLPAGQKAAMRANIKMPLIYAQVALRRWPAIAKSGLAAAYCPGSYFQFVQMDFPVSLGDYQPERGPEQPVVLLMIRMPCPMLGQGKVPELLRQGRAELLATTFETYEAKIREQLQAMYGGHGFDGARDIAAITVNRWPHGFVWDEAEYEGRPAAEQARQRHGRIVMANADAAGRAYTDAAIDMAWRAVGELNALE